MTSQIPLYLSVPVFIGIVITFIGRRLLLHSRVIDQISTRAVGAAIVAMALRESWFQQALAWALPGDDSNIVNLARQLSWGATLLIVAALFGLVMLWDGADPETAWRRQCRYDAFVLGCTAVMMIAGTPARRANLLVDEYLGWPAVVFHTAFCVPLSITTIALIAISTRELRSGDVTGRERAVYFTIWATFAALSCDIVYSLYDLISCVLTDSPVADPSMHRKTVVFFGCTFFAVSVTAIPMISTALARLGWDRTGRYLRRLRPLWSDLTAAIPEIVLDTSSRLHRADRALQLHRMSMEVRDGLRHLRRFAEFSETDTADPHTYAQWVAHAISAKNTGQPPLVLGASKPQRVPLGAHDPHAELLELLSLAKAWRHARGMIHDHGQRTNQSLASRS